MPVGMNSLATVLTMREYRYSFAAAGAVVGVYLAGLAAVSPLAGRLMDRAGLARVLIPCAVGYAAGIGLLLVLASRHAPLAALGAAALITGAAFPRVTSALRVRWPDVMPTAGLRDQAYLLEATLSEAGPIIGAVLVAVLASTITPAAALLTSAAFALAGTLGFVTSPAARRRAGQRAQRPRRRPPDSPPARAGRPRPSARPPASLPWLSSPPFRPCSAGAGLGPRDGGSPLTPCFTCPKVSDGRDGRGGYECPTVPLTLV
jgi:MFS family permease